MGFKGALASCLTLLGLVLAPGSAFGDGFPIVPLEQRVQQTSVSVAPSTVEVNGFLASWARLIALPDGRAWLAWQDKADLHLTPLDQTMKRVGTDVVLKGDILTEAIALPDGSVALAVARDIPGKSWFNCFKTPLALEIVRLSPQGREQFRTRVVGGEGVGPGKLWHCFSVTRGVALAYNRGEIGAFVKISRNFSEDPSKPNTHQGDLFVVLDSSGKEKPKSRDVWSASHSNVLGIVAAGTGEFETITSGDAYPFGVYYINRKTKDKAVVWPSEAMRAEAKKGRVGSTTAAGSPSGFVHAGGAHMTTISASRTYPTTWDAPRDPVLLRFDHKGKVLSTKWLAKTADVSERPLLAKYGQNFLVAWDNRDIKNRDRSAVSHAILSVVDKKGNVLEAPRLTKAPMNYLSTLTVFPNGDVGWAQVSYKSSTIEVIRVRR